MPFLSDDAIILKICSILDGARVLYLFSKDNGVIKGLVEISRVNRYFFRKGVLLRISWKASNTIGSLNRIECDLLDDIYANILKDKRKLFVLDLLLSTISAILPEGSRSRLLYDQALWFLNYLKRDDDWYQNYIELMIAFIKEIGMPLQIGSCAMHPGMEEKIDFIMPKTGLGVCAKVAEDMGSSKLLPLNDMLVNACSGYKGEYVEADKLFLQSLRVVKHVLYISYLCTNLPKSLEILCSSLEFDAEP